MTDHDGRRRQAARAWLDAESDATRDAVEVDLAAVLARADGLIGSHPAADRRRGLRWLIAASIAAVITGGVAVLALTGDDDEVRSSAPSTSIDPTPTATAVPGPSAPVAAPVTAAPTTAVPVAPPASSAPSTASPTKIPAGGDTLVPYVFRRGLEQPDPRWPVEVYFELRDIAPDGTDLGSSPADIVDLSGFPVDLGDGLAMGLSDNDSAGPLDGRCRVQAVGARWAEGSPRNEAPPVAGGSSIVGNAAGVVVGRDVCPPGTRWGDPGTYFELVRVDLSDPQFAEQQLVRIDPAPDALLFDGGDVIYSTDALYADAISPDARFVAVQQPLSSEQARWHVYSAETPGAPIALGSSCSAPGDIVGRPSFPSADVVVVARRCDGDENSVGWLVVEAVSLTDLRRVWSRQVDGVAISSYSRTVGNVSARFVDGELWVIVAGSAGVEQPVRASLLHGDDEIDLTREGDEWAHGYAFTAAELVDPRDTTF